MQSARNNAAIPILGRQQGVGPRAYEGTNSFSPYSRTLIHPQLDEADYNPIGDSLLFDDGCSGLFELEYVTDISSCNCDTIPQ